MADFAKLQNALDTLDGKILDAAAYLSEILSDDELSVDIDKDLVSFCELGAFADDESPSLVFEDGELFLRIETEDEVVDEPVVDLPIFRRILVSLSIPSLIALANSDVASYADSAAEDITEALASVKFDMAE